MKITSEMDCETAVKELSARFKQHRIYSDITQRELAKKTGVALRTISRFENGEEIGILTFMKLMKGVGLEGNFESIIPDYTMRPSYFVLKEQNKSLPKRVVKRKEDYGEWKWGDEL